MRKLIYIILLIGFTSNAQSLMDMQLLAQQQQSGSSDPILSLPLHFAFMASTGLDGNDWSDSSGNGFDATGSGSVFSAASDVNGDYIEWTGNGWFDVPDDSSLDVNPETDDFTIIWQYGPTKPPVGGYPVSKAPGTSTERVFGTYISGVSSHGPMYFGGNSGNPVPYATGPNQLSIVICDGGVLNWWIDGVQCITNLSSGSTATLTGQSWNIGSRTDGGYPALTGYNMRMAVLIDKAIDTTERTAIETAYQIN